MKPTSEQARIESELMEALNTPLDISGAIKQTRLEAKASPFPLDCIKDSPNALIPKKQRNALMQVSGAKGEKSSDKNDPTYKAHKSSGALSDKGKGKGSQRDENRDGGRLQDTLEPSMFDPGNQHPQTASTDPPTPRTSSIHPVVTGTAPRTDLYDPSLINRMSNLPLSATTIHGPINEDDARDKGAAMRQSNGNEENKEQKDHGDEEKRDDTYQDLEYKKGEEDKGDDWALIDASEEHLEEEAPGGMKLLVLPRERGKMWMKYIMR